MRYCRYSLITCFWTLALCGSSLQASIIVSYSGTSLDIGGSGFVDVFVSSDAAAGTPDLLDSFSAHFRITPIGAAPNTGLQFVDPQSDAHLSMPDYLFFGDSLSPPPLGLVSTTNNQNDTYVGGDATLSGTGVALDSSTPAKLLFRLDLSGVLATFGSQYTLQLVNDAGTSFLDTSFNPISVASSAFIPITFTAVPEPSTWGVAASLLIAAFVRHRKHRIYSV